MNLDLSKEQKMIKSSAKDFLHSKCPKDVVRELEDSELGYAPKLWQEMVELGWVGLVIPEEYEGMGMNFLDLTILLEEVGYNLLPGPLFSTAMGTIAILLEGTDEQKAEYLPKIADGKHIPALAISEPAATYTPAGILTEAAREGDDFIVNGTKLFVDYGHIADSFICPVRTQPNTNPEDGVSVFIIDSKSPGITTDIVPTMGLDKQCEINFSNVKVPAKNILGGLHQGWKLVEKILKNAQAGKCAEMLGGMQAALDMTNAFVKKRITYGRPVASYQVIQHYLADIWISLETSRNITYLAAWKINENLPYALEVSAAKAYVGKAFCHATERCIQMHGAMGLTREHDIGLYYRHAKACELAFGDGAHQKYMVAKEMNF